MASEWTQWHISLKVSWKIVFVRKYIVMALSQQNFKQMSLIYINHDYRFNQIDPEFKNEQVKMDKTYNQPEVLNLLQEFRAVLDEKTAEDTYNPRYTNKNSIDISI